MSEIDDKYNQLGGANSFLGLPEHEERPCRDGVGRYRTFQHGSIHWHPSTGAHETHGSIRAKWATLDWETGFLGYPVSDERAVTETELKQLCALYGAASPEARSDNRCSKFQGGRLFYWSPDGVRYFTTLITPDGQRTDEQHPQSHEVHPHTGAEAAKAAGAAAVGATAGYAAVAAAGLTAAGAVGSGAGIGAAAGPVGMAFGAIAGLAVYGIYRIIR